MCDKYKTVVSKLVSELVTWRNCTNPLVKLNHGVSNSPVIEGDQNRLNNISNNNVNTISVIWSS